MKEGEEEKEDEGTRKLDYRGVEGGGCITM